MSRPPQLVVHADWSAAPKKRWLVQAMRQDSGRYRIGASQSVGALEDLLPRLARAARGGPVLLGVDFPIGLPKAYATRAGIEDFVAELPKLGTGRWSRFYEVATLPEEVSLTRPFYPHRPGGRRRQHLIDRLGMPCFDALLRQCERRTGARGPACCLFWTLGGNQVGKGAIEGWKSLLAPALRARLSLGIWPFHGHLRQLLAENTWTAAETYPREAYRLLGLDLRGGKRRREVRARNGERLLAAASALALDPEPALLEEISSGFGGRPDGEDRFDAMVGLLCLLHIVNSPTGPWEPADPAVRSIEGWIIGQAVEPAGQ